MAVNGEFDTVNSFEDWYSNYRVDPRNGRLNVNGLANCAARKVQLFQHYKREMDARVKEYWKYEKIADAAIVNERPDLPNVSSGEAAGYLRRIARNVIQHTPNITITSKYDDDSIQGVIAQYICKSKIIGDDEYSSSMQQQLYAAMIRASAIGFDCVIPSLQKNAVGGWYTQFDNINYRDVFPEPGVKDVRRAPDVYVRRYLTRGEVNGLIKNDAPGWDTAALKTLLDTSPSSREYTDHQSKKHSVNSEAYEIITWYSNTGDHFLTWAESTKLLLRIEKNKHPLKEHPVFFFVPEYDGEQPFGRSLLSLIYGRQEFQDWFLNGAMKLWRLNIEPPIIGYGVVNAIPNLGPGKYTQIANPNAKVEAFEVGSSSLTMFNQITQGNAGNMAQLIGAADQQMAAQNGAQGMSQTAQGVEAQQDMVDTVTNNYQKALESFFSKYCSYALTVYFQELKGVTHLAPTAEARKQLLNAGIKPEAFIHEQFEELDPETGKTVITPEDDSGLKNGEIEADFSEMAVQYWVKTVPGSLTELEDEKQIRLLNQMFIPLSQALPALAQADPQVLQDAAAAMKFIITKQIELSGSNHSQQLKDMLNGSGDRATAFEDRALALEEKMSGSQSEIATTVTTMGKMMLQMQEQMTLIRETITPVLSHLGVQIPSSTPEAAEPPAPSTPAIL